MDKITLSTEEKAIIARLNVAPYTAEYVSEWINRNDNVFINAPAALIAMGVKGFYDAVKAMAANEAYTMVATLKMGVLAEILAVESVAEKISFCQNMPECDALLETAGGIPKEMCLQCALEWLRGPATIKTMAVTNSTDKQRASGNVAPCYLSDFELGNVLQELSRLDCDKMREKSALMIKALEQAADRLQNCTPNSDGAEKQIPRMVENAPKAVYGVCPNCRDYLSGDETYCSSCGQCLQWTDK